MTSYDVDQVSVCYQWGALGWALVWFALTAGKGFWMGAWWYACRMGDLYVTMMLVTGAFSWAAQYAVATFLLSGAPPFPECNNNVRSTPDLAVWLLYHYWVLEVVHEYYWQHPWSPWVTLRRLALGAAVPVILVLTGNTTWLHALYGALFGIGAGLISAVLLLVLWVPRMPAVSSYTMALGFAYGGTAWQGPQKQVASGACEPAGV